VEQHFTHKQKQLNR